MAINLFKGGVLRGTSSTHKYSTPCFNQTRGLKIIEPKYKKIITPESIAKPPKTFLSLNFIRRLPTDEIILDEKTQQTLKALPDHDKALFKELKEKEAVLQLKPPYDVTVYDPTPPKLEKLPAKLTFDLIWKKLQHREIYFDPIPPRESYWRIMCILSKTVDEWKKVKIFWNIWEKKAQPISEENQIAFTIAAINTGNLDYILSRIIEPAFRFKASPKIITKVLKELLKTDRDVAIYHQIDQAMRKMDKVEPKALRFLFRAYETKKDNKKAFNLWFFAKKFPEIYPLINVCLVRASLLVNDLKAAEEAAGANTGGEHKNISATLTALKIVQGTTIDNVQSLDKGNIAKILQFVTSLPAAENPTVQQSIKNFVENLKSNNVELPDLSPFPLLQSS